MRRLICVAFVIVLGGCTSAGVQVKPDQLQSFKAGETTYEQVVTVLGRPTSVVTQSGGGRIAVYSHVHAQARPESFIPIVGAFVGGADSTMNTVTLLFDESGVLQRYSTAETAVGSGTGFAAGRPIERTAQPMQSPR